MSVMGSKDIHKGTISQNSMQVFVSVTRDTETRKVFLSMQRGIVQPMIYPITRVGKPDLCDNIIC